MENTELLQDVFAASLLSQLDELISFYENSKRLYFAGDLRGLPSDQVAAFVSRMVHAIERAAPRSSAHYQACKKVFDRWGVEYYEAIPPLIGIIKALKDDIVKGYLSRFEELIHADLFSDFLEMSDHLNDLGYRDAAAVLYGSVIAGHLKKLAEKYEVDIAHHSTRKQASRLNEDLRKANIYGMHDQKQVTARLDLRNKAAHGEYKQYTSTQVRLMGQGIKDFVMRYPA